MDPECLKQTHLTTFQRSEHTDSDSLRQSRGDSDELKSPGLTIPENAQWFVVQTPPNRDDLACKHFSYNNIACYSPTYRPLGAPRESRIFPGYIFAALTLPEDLTAVNANPYAIWVLGAGRQALPVPDAEVLWIREMAAHRSAQPEGAVEGDWVRVVRGPMAAIGVEGRVVRSKGALRLVVELTILGRGVSVEIDRRDVERIRGRAER